MQKKKPFNCQGKMQANFFNFKVGKAFVTGAQNAEAVKQRLLYLTSLIHIYIYFCMVKKKKKSEMKKKKTWKKLCDSQH